MRNLLCLFVILFVFNISELQSQNKKDTIYLSDTMVVRKFNHKEKLSYATIHLNGEAIEEVYWIYRKKYYGFTVYSKAKGFPKITNRKQFYLNGNLQIEGHEMKAKWYSKYKTHGKFLSYHENGMIECDCYFINGKRDGIQIYHFENGETGYIHQYKLGKKDGLAITYYDNGVVYSEIIYKDNIPFTVLERNDANGNPIEKGTLKDGNGERYVYDENLKLIAIEYYSDGKLKNKRKIK